MTKIKAKFKLGDILEHKVSGEKAIVISEGSNRFGENWYRLDASISSVSKSYDKEYVHAAFKKVKGGE